MQATDIEQAASELRLGRRRAIERLIVTLAAATSAAATSTFSPRVAMALAAGAAVEGILAVSTVLYRRDLIARLALHPAAYALPEVERFGMRYARPQERARLAAWLDDIVVEARLPGSIYLADRVDAHAAELKLLARDFGRPVARVQPTSAVACRQLLAQAVDSPLYNPRVPVEDLLRAVAQIRSGIEAD